MASGTSTKSSTLPLFILLLLLLLGLLIFGLPSLNLRLNVATQSNSQGQCAFNSIPFDAQKEAFILATNAQEYRTTHQTARNYANASITLCEGNAARAPLRSQVYYGYNALSGPPYTTHAEQFAHDQWIIPNLTGVSKSNNYTKITYIYVIIFSQVRICDGCKETMKKWLSEFKKVAGTNNLDLSVWQLTKGYDPRQFPAGKPVTSTADVTQVLITFAS